MIRIDFKPLTVQVMVPTFQSKNNGCEFQIMCGIIPLVSFQFGVTHTLPFAPFASKCTQVLPSMHRNTRSSQLHVRAQSKPVLSSTASSTPQKSFQTRHSKRNVLLCVNLVIEVVKREKSRPKRRVLSLRSVSTK